LSLTVWVSYSFSEFDAVGLEKLSNYVKSRKMTAKVTQRYDFDTDRKPVCDVLLVNNTNLCAISHRFRVFTAYWWNCRFWQWVALGV